MEPVTFTAIVAALSTGLTAGVGKAGEDALADAYQALKTTLKRRFGDEDAVVEAVDVLEKKPESESRKGMLREEVDRAAVDQDPEVLDMAQKLLEQIEAQPGGEQHVQYAKGSYIAQADRGSSATVDVDFTRERFEE